MALKTLVHPVVVVAHTNGALREALERFQQPKRNLGNQLNLRLLHRIQTA